jgi:transcriptional regulator with XRE-family HTH domain
VSIAKQFGHNLAACRRRARLSQPELGERVSLNRTAISALERGKRIARVDLLLKLATALGVEPSELLDGLSLEAGETVEGRFIETAVPGLGAVHRRFEIRVLELE